MNEKLSVVDQQLLKTANRKQQNTDNVLWLVENCDIKLENLHKHNPFVRITDLDNCDIRAFFFVKLFTWPRNYYNDNKEVMLICNTRTRLPQVKLSMHPGRYPIIECEFWASKLFFGSNFCWVQSFACAPKML